jgi:hypothetical protein
VFERVEIGAKSAANDGGINRPKCTKSSVAAEQTAANVAKAEMIEAFILISGMKQTMTLYANNCSPTTARKRDNETNGGREGN